MADKQYIEREAVLESISGLTWYSKNKKGVLNIGAVNRKEAYYPAVNVFDAVESVPAADVVPVVHAEWVMIPVNGVARYRCGNIDCCRLMPFGCSPGELGFCPHCGARMDGGKHG